MDFETRQQFEKSTYARIATSAVAYLGQALELCINLRDIEVIREMESLCCSMFQEAKAILNEKESLQ